MTPRDELDRRELARQDAKVARGRNDRLIGLAVLAFGFFAYGIARSEPIPLVIGAVLAVWTVIVYRQP